MASITVKIGASAINTKQNLAKTIESLSRLHRISDAPIKFTFDERELMIARSEFNYVSAQDNDFIRIINASNHVYATVKDEHGEGYADCGMEYGLFQVLEIGTKD